MKSGRFASERIAILSLLLLSGGWLAMSQSPVAGQKTKPKPAAKPAAESKDSEEPEVNAEGKVVKTEAEWRKLLTKQQFRVTRQKDTEQPFLNAYWKTKKAGTYQCVCCKLDLFDSETKFDSGTGWPSFWQPLEKEAVIYEVDNTEGVPRTEVLCRRCDAHLGHVFADGPAPTGQRFCMNSASLKFVERVKVEKKAEPPAKSKK